jgi:tetratricopeptide (TPR) repeat protein
MSDAALQRAAGLFSAGRLDEARALALGLASSHPTSFLVFHLLGAIAVNSGRPEEGLEYETRALQLKPHDLEALCNRGIALRMVGRVEEAIADYERVLALKARFVPALNLRGAALAALNRHDDAIASYTEAIAIDWKFAPARFNRSLSELARGDFDAGWHDFEWRWGGSDTQVAKRDFRRPQWQGEDPAGRTILVHAEQGMGDAIQFCRYVPLLAARGANVVLEVQPALEGLFSQLPARVIRMGGALPEFDWHCPIMSLGFAFGTRVDSIPANLPYLKAPADRVERWREKLGPRTGARVGIAWSGSVTLRNDRNRTIPLGRFASLRDGPWSLVSLQKEVRETDRAALAAMGTLRHFGDELSDFRDAAALIELVDVVVCVDTAAAHLAGAMGKPVLILLPFAADWRWLLDRTDSPWYPAAKLLRQPRPGDWDFVLAQLTDALRAHNPAS